MKHQDKTVSDLVIAYIGGGSKGWAWNLMGDLAMEADLSGTIRLYDIDAEAARRNAIIGNSLKGRSDVRGKWEYSAVPSLEQALSGADFVIMSILPGTFAEMQSDVHAPEAYGIWQSVGDTTGPGGLLRALRALPMYAVIAQAIRDYAPQAWVINYTNPMSLCTRVLYEVFPDIKAFGCCHEVFGTQKILAAMLGEMGIASGVKHQEIKTNVLGINHFTWLDKASWRGIDLFPLYREFADRHWLEGYSPDGPENWLNSFFHSANRVKFDLFRRYGLIAAAGDRHLAEFMPPWYLKDPDTAKSWKFSLTPVSWRVRHKAELEAASLRLASGQEAVELKSSGEEGILQIKALLGLGELVTNLNLPNRGQAPDLPMGAVVETNAILSRNGIQPVIAGSLPSELRALVLRPVLNQETILRAALTKDRALAFRAFMNDPLVTIDPAAGEQLFAAMLANTKACLPGWDILPA